MDADLLTLAELAGQSGVEIRTLRSWIAQGVVPGPRSAGRNARYPAAALNRARAVRAMRELFGMSLPDIRRELLTADEAKIEALAAQAGSPPAAEAASPPPPSPAPAGTSAADYLSRLRRDGVFGGGRPAPASGPPTQAAASLPPRPSGSRVDRLVEALEQFAGAGAARRKARGEARLAIPITPELELVLRGDHTPEEIARYEQIADLLRAILTGAIEP